MKGGRYFEEIYELESIMDINSLVGERFPLVVVWKKAGKNFFVPTYRLLRLVDSGDPAGEEISFFSRNPGLKRITKMFARRNKHFIIFPYKSRYYAVTPRSLFIYMVESLFREKLLYIFDKMIHHSKQCFQYNTKIDKIVKALLEKRSNFAPICRRGRITRIVSTVDILNLYARYEESIDDLHVFDIKAPLFFPEKTATYSEVVDSLRRRAHSIYVVSGKREYFIDEVSMYEAIREVFAERV